MATHYIARGEPIVVSAGVASTVTYATAAGIASYDITVAASGNLVLVSMFLTGGTSSGNIVVLSGTTKVTAPINPPGSPANLTILTTTTTGSSTVYITPIVSMVG